MATKASYLFPKSAATLKKSLSAKLTALYLVLLIVSLLVTGILYQFISQGIMETKVGDASAQALQTMQSSVDNTLDTVNSFSKLILSHDTIQRVLVEGPDALGVDTIRQVQTALSLYIEASSAISSIYLYDNNGQQYNVNRLNSGNIQGTDFTQASWHETVVALRGRSMLVKNAGGLLQGASEDQISHIRLVNSTQTAQPIGLLVINIPVSTLETLYGDSTGSYSEIAVFYEDEPLVGFDTSTLAANTSMLRNAENGFVELEKQRYLIYSMEDASYGWKYVAATAFNDVAGEYNQFRYVAIVILVLNSIVLVWGAIMISRTVTRPLKKLTQLMKKAETGNFEKVEEGTRQDEIGLLQEQYNTMVKEIESLISKVISEQRFKRKAELNMLQGQIKPHFLYNSLEAIAAQALIGDNKEENYELIIALANYYRLSLSKGSEVITLAQEVDIVKNYMLIQKVRFPALFTMDYDVDVRLANNKIMKLVLQPLVENALYHGLQPKGEPGTIRLVIQHDENRILITVQDDGVGMTEERLRMIVGGELESNMSSFGLRGTIERLRIFHDNDVDYEIVSEVGKGTTIRLALPIKE